MVPYLRLFEHVLLGAALALPVAGAAVAGLARWRLGRGVPARPAWARSVAEVGMLAGTVPWLILGLWPIDLPPEVARWRLLPFTDTAAQLSGSVAGGLVQLVANLLVFFALGAFAPVRFAWPGSAARLFALGGAASLALELSQQLFGTGRVFSVDDVLLNAAGCLLGGLATRRWWAGRRRPQPTGTVTAS